MSKRYKFLGQESPLMDVLVMGAVMLGLSIVVGAILAVPVMLLWNYAVVAAVPAAAKITWLQAWALMLLISILSHRLVRTTGDD